MLASTVAAAMFMHGWLNKVESQYESAVLRNINSFIFPVWGLGVSRQPNSTNVPEAEIQTGTTTEDDDDPQMEDTCCFEGYYPAGSLSHKP